MAPAAKPSAQGRIGRKIVTTLTPTSPNKGSNKPVIVAITKERVLVYPTVIKEKATAKPSGIFCNPIPIAKLVPLAISPPPKPTPTAKPSGIL